MQRASVVGHAHETAPRPLIALASLALLASLAPALRPTAAYAADPDASKIALATSSTRLDNGLEVILHEDHRTPIVAVEIWYHVGSKDEPAGRQGFAHLFEHLMFQGSKHVPEDTYFRYLERTGASNVNGTTNQDRTNYFETVPKNRLELALWLESDRMGFLLEHVDEQTFAGQREVVKNERRQNYENAPYGMVPRFVAEALYAAAHPYHHLTIGSLENLDRATLEDVRRFFRTWYLPSNATLVVAGDIDPQATRAVVDKYFGPILGDRSPEQGGRRRARRITAVSLDARREAARGRGGRRAAAGGGRLAVAGLLRAGRRRPRPPGSRPRRRQDEPPLQAPRLRRPDRPGRVGEPGVGAGWDRPSR